MDKMSRIFLEILEVPQTKEKRLVLIDWKIFASHSITSIVSLSTRRIYSQYSRIMGYIGVWFTLDVTITAEYLIKYSVQNVTTTYSS